MPGRFNPDKEKPKVQRLCPSTGGVLRSEGGGAYLPATPVRHFAKPRSDQHLLKPSDKVQKRRFLAKVCRNIFTKPAPQPIVPYRHKLPAPARVVTFEELQKRADEQRQREKERQQQHIRQELVKRLATTKKQSVQPGTSANNIVGCVSVVRGFPLCCGAWVPCYTRYKVNSDQANSDCDSVSSVCSPAAVDECESN